MSELITISLNRDDAVTIADWLAGISLPLGDTDSDALRTLYGALGAALELAEVHTQYEATS